mgnify:FL=1
MDLRQFKLSSDEEIICEVVEWNDSKTDHIVIRRPLKIFSADDLDPGLRYYIFKPWISMATDTENLSVLNSFHVISETKPSTPAAKYYYEVVHELSQIQDEEFERLSSIYEDSDQFNLLDKENIQIH